MKLYKAAAVGLFVLFFVCLPILSTNRVTAEDGDENCTVDCVIPNPSGDPSATPTPSDEPSATPTPSGEPSGTPTPSATPTPQECSATGGFEAPTFTTGSVNGQDGWKATGPYDQAVVSNTYGYASFGCQSLRVSDAIASGSFGDWIFAKPQANAVGEASSTIGSQEFNEGTRQNRFETEFDIASTQPNYVQYGLHVSVSPDRGDGSRMSYLRFDDKLGPDETAGGIYVYFDDVISEANEDEGFSIDFRETEIGTALDRTVPHHVKLTFDAIDGPSNDVVNVYIDGVLVHTGTSWEDYYRYDSEASAEQSPRVVNTIIIQARGQSNSENIGKGFLFDNVNVTTGQIPPAPTPTPPQTGGGAPYIPPTPTPTPTGEVLGASTSTNPLGSPVNPIVIDINNNESVILACPPYITTFIKFGSKNNAADVKRLQEFLNKHQDAKLPVTGFYGPLSRAAVIKFQKTHSDLILKPWVDLGYIANIEAATGYVYKTTQWQVNSLNCPSGTTLPAPILP